MKFMIHTDRVDTMEATMQITMTVAQWRQLREQIDTAHPGWKFATAIRELIERADAHFEENVEVKP